ncbi:hypothetical protein [Streptomyces griseicoloratus]|uniref:hypothetical protein n=1 Tax=Streptomyces griseicoloratus TaxID=2752516 RepID=UPI00281121A2|nr:hypothetical protein [Streptomyces griseicoloratus]
MPACARKEIHRPDAAGGSEPGRHGRADQDPDREAGRLQLTGHARALAADVQRHAAALPENDGRGPLAAVILREAAGRLSQPIQGTAHCAQNRARFVGALYERLDRLEAAPATRTV